MHSLQAESELFRGQCQNDDEEEAFEEYQRKMRQAARDRQHSARRRAPQPAATTSRASANPPISTSVQEQLEREHASREAAHERRAAVELRLEELTAASNSSAPSAPITAEELKTTLIESKRTEQLLSTEFVGAYR